MFKMIKFTKSIFILLAAFMLLAGFYLSPALAVSVGDVPNVEHYEQVVEGHGADETHANKDSGGLPQLNPSSWASQGFWLLIVFGVMYFMFTKAALPNISKTIDNRKNHIQSDLQTAEKLTAKADKVHDAYQAGLTDAQQNAAHEVQKVEEDIKKKSAKAFDDYRRMADQEINSAEERIEQAKAAAMDDMNSIAAEAAANAVEKIIGRSTKANEVKTIVENMNGKVSGKVKAA